MDVTPKPELGAPLASDIQLHPGEFVGSRYRVIERVATGGMADIYRVEQVELQRVWALKMLLPALASEPRLIERFRREAAVVSRLENQHIVSVVDFGQVHEHFYFVMEYVDGRTLRRALGGGPFSVARTTHIALQLARALDVAHRAGLVHRDLKPENVMLTNQGGETDFVKVLDFGVAKIETSSVMPGLTRPGAIVGTPQYMAPEQVAAQPVDARTDVYTLGLLMHEMLSGRRTFSAPDPHEVYRLQLEGVPAPLSGDVPPELNKLVMRMLAKRPSQRPSSMREVIDELDDSDPSRPDARTELVPGVWGVSTTSTVTSTPVPAASAPTSTAAPLRQRHAARVAPAPRRESPTPTSPTSGIAQVNRSSVDLDPAALRSSRAPWVIAVLAVIAAASVSLWASRGRTTNEVAPPTPTARVVPDELGSSSRVVAPGGQTLPSPSPKTVKISLTSEPVGAEVYSADVLLGVTPLALTRTSDAMVELRFEARGYEPVTRKMMLHDDAAVNVVLSRKGPPVTPFTVPQPAAKSSGDLKDNPF